MLNPRVHFVETVNQAALEILSPVSAEYVQARFGLLTGETRNLEEMSEAFGCSPQGVRDDLRESLRKFRLRAGAPVVAGRLDALQQLCQMVTFYLGSNESEIGARLVQFTLDAYPNSRISWLHFELILAFYNPEGIRVKGIIVKVAALKALKYRKFYAPPGYKVANYPYLPPVSTSVPPATSNGLKSIGYWPSKVQSISEAQYKSMVSKRRVQLNIIEDKHSVSGTLDSAKMGCTVEFESLLERDFYEKLESDPEVVWYVVQPLSIQYGTGSRLRNYYPDVQVFFSDGSSMLVEIKPVLEMACWLNWHKWKGMKKHCEEAGLGYAITDGTTSTRDIRAFQLDSARAGSIIEDLHTLHELDWKRFVAFRARHKVSNLELARIIVDNHLSLTPMPFLLRNEPAPQ